MLAAASLSPVVRRANRLAFALAAFLLAIPLFANVSAQAVECRRNGSSSQNLHQSNDGDVRWLVRWSGSNCSVELRATGELRFSNDFTDILSISRGGSLEITEERGNTVRRMTMKQGVFGQSTRTWIVDGRERPWDDNARRWLADLLIDVDRHTAIGVAYRYPMLFEQGGPNAVINEAEKMESDYAQSVYLRRLIDSAPLTDSEYERVVGVAARDISSDYELSRILRSVADRTSLENEPMRRSYLRAVERMSSDYERSRVLQTIVARSSTSHEVGAAAVRVAGTFSSDYERSRVLLAAIGNKSLSVEDVIPIVETVMRSSSDYEKARVLLAVASRWSITGDARKAYLRAADTIRSDYENRRVLSALVNQEPR
ncbi:MAG TPA: hypothetical protein VIP11_12735 [Gemmatimonadaceae bacterium]